MPLSITQINKLGIIHATEGNVTFSDGSPPEQREEAASVSSKIWPGNKRLTVDVLVQNAAAIASWRAVCYKDYCLTLALLQEGLS